MLTSGEKYQTPKKGNWNFNIGRLFICVNSESDNTLEYIVAFYVFFLKKHFIGVKILNMGSSNKAWK